MKEVFPHIGRQQISTKANESFIREETEKGNLREKQSRETAILFEFIYYIFILLYIQ